ncbi:MAG: DUF4296 domain-containing protein [Bacteroidales bacterium]|nr:DUF4296 domain-containing protein [Bacteroidales bacterium]MDD4670364.1 DUF4296 domain-containing protein [Bacteroidales bacterium]
MIFNKRYLRYWLIIAIAITLTNTSCKEETQIQPQEMADIYYDLWLLDQYVDSVPEMRTQADTMCVYQPLLEKHGYTVDQFLTSVKYYLKDPDKYQKILKQAKAKLDKREKFLSKQQELKDGLIEGADVDNAESSVESSDIKERRLETIDTSTTDEVKKVTDTLTQLPLQKEITRKSKEKKLTKKDLKELEKRLK